MLRLGRVAQTPSCLGGFLLREGVAGEDPDFQWALLPSATFSRTCRPLTAGATEINHCLRLPVCSVTVRGLAFLCFSLSCERKGEGEKLDWVPPSRPRLGSSPKPRHVT